MSVSGTSKRSLFRCERILYPARSCQMLWGLLGRNTFTAKTFGEVFYGSLQIMLLLTDESYFSERGACA